MNTQSILCILPEYSQNKVGHVIITAMYILLLNKLRTPKRLNQQNGCVHYIALY